MSATIVALEAGAKVIEIICTKYVENESNKRGQRFKLSIKKKMKEGNREMEVEITAEFGSEATMAACAEKWRAIAPSVPIKNQIAQN